jgi:uncharacterized protein (DUF1330 family)
MPSVGTQNISIAFHKWHADMLDAAHGRFQKHLRGERPMKVNYKIVIALVAGTAIGGAAIQGLHAQAKAPAYTIAEIDVTDEVAYKAYVDGNSTLLAAAGGHFIVRGGKNAVLAGAPPKRSAVVAWDNFDQAQAYYNSAAYKALIPNRDKSSNFRAFIIEGVAK